MIGTYAAAWTIGKKMKSSGATPIIVYGSLFSVSV